MILSTIALGCQIEAADSEFDSAEFAQTAAIEEDVDIQRGTDPIIVSNNPLFAHEEAMYAEVTERIRLLHGELAELQSRAFRTWAQAQRELADARIRHVAADIKALAARQIELDALVIESRQRYELQRIAHLIRHHRIATQIRNDGSLSQGRITALKNFIIGAAIGSSRESLLAQALLELKGLKPAKFQRSLNDEGEIAMLGPEHFIPRPRTEMVETYWVKIPKAPPPDDGLWELHVLPQWQGEYRADIEVRILDLKDKMPSDWQIAATRIHRISGRPEFEGSGRDRRYVGKTPDRHENRILLNADLPPDGALWVKLRGGARNELGPVPIRPRFHFVPMDMSGRAGKTPVYREAALHKRLPNPPPMAVAFPGGNFIDLLRFCSENDFDIRGHALEIFDHVLGKMESHAKQSVVEGLKEMTELRDALLKFEKDVLETRAGILQEGEPGALLVPTLPLN
jgi:hypothetical protein